MMEGWGEERNERDVLFMKLWERERKGKLDTGISKFLAAGSSAYKMLFVVVCNL